MILNFIIQYFLFFTQEKHAVIFIRSIPFIKLSIKIDDK